MTATHDHPSHAFLPGLGHHRLTPLYDLVARLLGVPAIHRRLADLADVGSHDRVLEIGCGTGDLAAMVARRRPAADVVGLDPDPAALARARRKAGREGLPARFDEGVAERLPYPDASFDVVLSSLMLHHVDPGARVQALREVRRVLAPGGRLLLADLGGEGPSPRGLAGRIARRNPRMLDGLGDRIPALLQEAGLTEPTAVARLGTRFTGPVTAYRATAPGAA